MNDNSKLSFTIEREEPLYKGFFNAARYFFRHSLFRGGESSLVAREAFIRTPAAAALLYDPVLDNVVLVEQFRVGPMIEQDYPWMLEVVAGIAEPGEKPEDVVMREAVEESGCHITQLLPIHSFYPSPGACNEVIHLFCGLINSKGAGGIHGLDEEQEDIKVHVIPAQQALDMLTAGKINNATTIIALQWLQNYRTSEQTA
ncbi:NUDIX domain-containing protein [Parendozoicomonas haliclonae]|uniref:ADP-ribose pyrophosphatase n=1 Tax=Parendozoicomonas haliclonae TaxID=1960125 RepID=A0A1X7AJI3_9GAMM|nr:NUDIX domain-containing protein [Parendozoicomonas haliclonae]SMA45843.1 ADP-ribose pyrophosphatase [Parendozoicomonas haliclonae]